MTNKYKRFLRIAKSTTHDKPINRAHELCECPRCHQTGGILSMVLFDENGNGDRIIVCTRCNLEVLASELIKQQ